MKFTIFVFFPTKHTSMNISQKAIESGFVLITPKITKDGFNGNFENNWFGVSLYHPDFVFQKGNKKIMLSLNGGLCIEYINKFLNNEEFENIMPLLKAASCKMIYLEDDGNKVHFTATGKLPPKEILESFLQ